MSCYYYRLTVKTKALNGLKQMAFKKIRDIQAIKCIFCASKMRMSNYNDWWFSENYKKWE